MKLIGGPNSPFVRKVAVTLIEKGLIDRVELIRVDPPATMLVVNPGLLALNPLGKIPALETDAGDLLFESDLICDWIDSNFGGPKLIPAEGGDRWRSLRWNTLGTGALEMLVIWRLERLKPVERRMAELTAGFEAKLDAVLTEMDRVLPKLEAAPLDLGQIALACFLGYLDFRFDDLDWRKRWPAGVAWYDRIAARPSMQATLPEQPDADGKALLAWQ